MRRNLLFIFWIAAAIAAVILVSSIVGSTELEQAASRLEEAVMAQDWQEAEEGYRALVAEWKRRRPWAELTNGVELTYQIDRALARLKAAIRTEERGEAAGLLADLSELWYEVRR